MRRIPLKTPMIRLPGQREDTDNVPFSYAANLIGVINAAAAERGLPLSEINRLLRILGPLEVADAAGAESFLLEDADWQNLKKLVDGFRGWRVVHAVIPALVKDIAEAECIAPPGVVSADT